MERGLISSEENLNRYLVLENSLKAAQMVRIELRLGVAKWQQSGFGWAISNLIQRSSN
jgi:hypothetical protein